MSDFLHALRDQLHLTKTAWLLTAGSNAEGSGTFNPDGANHRDIFGVDHSETPGAPGRNKISQESQGDNNNLFDEGGTIFLGPQILGVPGSGDQQADLDAASFVDGAAAALLVLGRQKGIVKPLAPAAPPVSTPKVTPKAPAKHDAPKVEAGSVDFRHEALVSDLKRILARLKEVPLPSPLPSEEHFRRPAVAVHYAIEELERALLAA